MASERCETGTLAFGDDWAGVFIRGDEAEGWAITIARLLEYLEEVNYDDKGVIEKVDMGDMKDLVLLFRSVQLPQATTQCRDFSECQKEME